ncbi:hypothetical protein STRIP9103_08917 [Streptomyces ipomoeae 91-03]|uniref:Uncharacterized protein n=1 Tax=Streptomyces ipomoeae 91-03 TaxID=698759 RepID=L1KLL8_9ACTN|nr:hypothetical protein STRIP9103_08917 [Streptomyces ipomoeae 91-03]
MLPDAPEAEAEAARAEAGLCGTGGDEPAERGSGPGGEDASSAECAGHVGESPFRGATRTAAPLRQRRQSPTGRGRRASPVSRRPVQPFG